eukprot:scaffold65652_cov71-Phaeocystis_antarctica.AAC.3
MCSIPTPSSPSTSTSPPFCSHLAACCRSPLLVARRTSSGSAAGSVRRFEQHGLRLALHRYRVPPLGRVEAPRYTAPPVELRPRLEATNAHAAAREVGSGGGGSGRLRGCVLSERLSDGGVVFALSDLQRRAAELVAQLGAGARLPSSSFCTHSVWPSIAAAIRAVPPAALCRSMLALCSSSRRTMACCPSIAADMRAVMPWAARRSMLAPRFSSSFATRRRPPDAAACSNPSPSLSGASTCLPCCNHSITCCSSPWYAARTISSVIVSVGAAVVAGGAAACCRSSSAMAECPMPSASPSAVPPHWSRSSVLAPASSSSCTHSWLPALALTASIRAVIPPASCRSTLALCSSSRRTMARRPTATATMRAVRTQAPRRSTLAPRFSSSFATCKCPPCAAACSSPSPSSPSASTGPPFCSHSTTDCSSPRSAALAISKGTVILAFRGRDN